MLSYITERNVERMIDAKNVEITRKINGDYTLSFIAIDEPDLLEELIVICEGQKYRIKQLSSTMSGNKTLQSVTCKHISFDLIDYYAYDYLTNTVTLDKALQFLFKGTPFTYSISDSIKNQSFEKLGECNKQKLLAKIIDAYGLEYEVDNYHFTFKKTVGYETEFQFRYKANISNVKKDIDTTSLTTYIRGYGKQDDKGNYICTAEYTSPNAEKFGVRHADPVFDERFTIQTELLEYIKTKINDTPDIVVELDYTQIDASQPINLGDYGYLIHEPLQLDLLSRVIEITKKLSTDRQGNNYQNMTYKIGSQKLVKSSFETNKDLITGDLNIPAVDYDRIQAEIEAGKQEATDMINSGLGGYVTKTRNELLIMDTEDKATARNLWRWNINGLGFSSNGYSGPYATAMTSDGKINADRILVGTIDGALIRANTIQTNSLELSTVQKINSAITADEASSIMNTRLEVYDGNIKTHINTVAESKKTEAINNANANTSSAINAAKSELNQSINTAKSDLTSKINLKANASDVYGKSEVYTKTQTDSAIKQSKDSISLEVSNTYETKVDATAKITNLQITGVNRALNTDGESEVWNITNSANQTWTPYKIAEDVSGQKVIIAFDYKATNIVKGANPAIRFQSTFKDPSDVSQWYPTFDFNLAEGTSEGTVVSSPITFGKIKKGTQASFRFRFDNVAGTFQISKARVFIGSKDLGWSPAPEDVNSLIDTAAINAINSANQNTATVIANYYTKSETDSKISVAKDEINLGVSTNYETKANVETKVTSTLNSAKSYADTKKTEAINAASTDATNKANNAKNEAINSANNTLTTTIANYYTKEQTDSQIKVAKDAINLGVSQTYETKATVETKINNAVDNIKIGGNNLISKTSGYTMGYISVSNGNVLDGVTGNQDFYTNDYFFVKQGNPVTFTSYPKDGVTSSIKSSVHIHVYNTDKVWQKCVYSDNGVANAVATVTYTAESDCYVRFTSRGYNDYNHMAEFSNKASEWSPSSIDVAAQITNAKNDAITSANNTLTTTIANYYTKEETNSQINIAKEAINLGVSQTYETKTDTTTKINNAVNGIKIGGTNLITKKSAYTYGYIDMGNGSFNPTGSLNGNQDFYTNDYIFVKNGTPITFTSYPKQGVTSSIQSAVYIHFYNTDKVWQWCKSDTTSANNIATTTYTTEGDCYVRFSARGFNDYNHMAEFSNKPSEWSPSPKDIDVVIDTKANSADVYTKSEVYTKNETNSQINVAKNEVTTTVSNLRTEVMSTTYNNLLWNSDFLIDDESGYFYKGYERTSSQYVSKGDWLCPQGGKTVVISTVDANTNWQGFRTPKVKVDRGQQLTASVYVASNDVNAINPRVGIEIEWFSADGTRITTNGYGFKPSTSNTWERVSVTGVAPEGAVTADLYCWNEWKGTSWWGKPMLQLGGTMTAWTRGGDFEKVEERLSYAEQKITDSAITNTVKQNFYTKQETENQITSKGYQTESQVQQTVNAVKFSFQESGGYNLLKNSKWDAKKEQWTFTNDSYVSVIEDAAAGTNYLRCQTVNGATHGCSQTIKVEKDNTYVASAKVDFDNGAIAVLRVQVNGSTYYAKTNQASQYRNKVLFVPFPVTTSGDAVITLYTDSSSTTGKYARFRYSQVELGSEFSPWSPNPYEIYGGVATIDKDKVRIEHSNGSYSQMAVSGFKRFDAGTSRDYHYLSSNGVINVSHGTPVTVTLPSEFKGKDFKVTLSIYKINIPSGVGWNGIYDIDSYTTNIDRNNAKFTVEGMVKSVNGQYGTVDISYVVIA